LHTKKEFLNSLDRKLRSVGFETRVIKTRQAELYAIVRLLKPNIIVETGVENGISASFILQALKDNNYGKLYSIEITQILANGREAGWIIPSDLKSRWELLIGNSLEVLPILCRSLHSIDIFIHDSEHSYPVMFGEYLIVWPYIRSGGFLISDDTGENEAFINFSQRVNVPACWTLRGYGILRKP